MKAIAIQAGEPGPIAQYWQYLRDNRFMLQRSKNSGEYVFYPRIMLPGSGAADLEWVEASGNGTVYATCIVPRKEERGGDYNVALIDLDEGVRMMSRVAGIAPIDVKIGMKVSARIEVLPEDQKKDDAQPLVVFYPEEASS
jgi:uncharacterized OB-fold protein